MIIEKLQNDVNSSLKAGNKVRVGILRYLLSQLKYKEINSGKVITDEEAVVVLRGEVKKRHEAIEMFKKGNRPDLVAGNEKEIEIIGEFLPASMPEYELEKLIDAILSDTQLDHPGKIIGLVMQKAQGKADGTLVARLVNEKLKKG